MYLTLSTGMGGGYIENGQIYRGHMAAILKWAPGRAPLPVSGTWPAPAERRCLEALISGNGVVRVYGKRAEELEEDEWQEVGYNLGLGLRNLANHLPDVIVLGGGVSVGGGEHLSKPAREVMTARLKLVPPPEGVLQRAGATRPLCGGPLRSRWRITREPFPG